MAAAMMVRCRRFFTGMEAAMNLTYEDLRICHSLAVEAREIMDRVDAIEAMATRMGISSCNENGGSAFEVEDYVQGRRRVAQAYLAHVAAVKAKIEQITNDTQRRVLQLRYVDGMRWEQIQVMMSYSQSAVYAVHKSALEQWNTASWG